MSRLGRQSQLSNMIGTSAARRGTSLAAQPATERACDPYRPAPDLALNLEVTDHVNQKKANTCALSLLYCADAELAQSSRGRCRSSASRQREEPALVHARSQCARDIAGQYFVDMADLSRSSSTSV
jgi:hypothetical protein